MNQKDKEVEQERDSLKDVIDFQNNMFNPGHYIGTGRVPPTVSAPGNAMPLAVLCFLAAVFFGVLGMVLLFSDVRVSSSGLVESDTANKIIVFIILLVISLFFLLLAFGYLKKARRYYKKKAQMEPKRHRRNR